MKHRHCADLSSRMMLWFLLFGRSRWPTSSWPPQKGGDEPFPRPPDPHSPSPGSACFPRRSRIPVFPRPARGRGIQSMADCPGSNGKAIRIGAVGFLEGMCAAPAHERAVPSRFSRVWGVMKSTLHRLWFRDRQVVRPFFCPFFLTYNPLSVYPFNLQSSFLFRSFKLQDILK